MHAKSTISMVTDLMAQQHQRLPLHALLLAFVTAQQ
jgi:hypothetical protein